MTDDITEDGQDKPAENVVNFKDYKENKASDDPHKMGRPETILGGKTPGEWPSMVRPSRMRRYLIDTKNDGSIEIEGFVGLTASFLAIGDDEGRIKFGAAQGEWLFVTDITDSKIKYEDEETDPPAA